MTDRGDRAISSPPVSPVSPAVSSFGAYSVMLTEVESLCDSRAPSFLGTISEDGRVYKETVGSCSPPASAFENPHSICNTSPETEHRSRFSV